MGKVRQKKNKVVSGRIILAIIFASLLFITGFLISYILGYSSLDKIKEFEKQYYKNLGTMLALQLSESKNFSCEDIDNNEIRKERIKIGQELYNMESVFGKNDQKVLLKKEFFHLLEIQEYLLLKEVNEKCKKNYTLILFFYSNKGDCDDCIAEGIILDHLWKNDRNISVFAFDYNIINPATEMLKKIYGIKGYPALVINGKTFNRFLTLEEIKKIIKENAS